MAKIKAFSGIRPEQNLVSRIAALPYDVYNRQEAKAEVEKEPLSFLKIDRAETQLDDEVDTYAPQVYQKAHDILWEMIREGAFTRDVKPCYYLYELTMHGRVQTGLVACASIDDYLNGVIKKHENTRSDKEQDRINHVDACNAQTGPIFLAYRRREALEEITAEVKKGQPLFDFTSDDGVLHRGWRISEEEKMEAVTDQFAGIEQIYIADGHHRAASAVKVGQLRRKANPGYDGTEEFNYFLSVLFPGEELMILDYNRVVKDLNGLSEEAFIQKIEAVFELEKVEAAVRPERKGTIGMYLKGHWYHLEVREAYCSDDPVEGLDVSVLQREVLSAILGIQNPKTDKRIDFIGGIRGLQELERRVNEGGEVAFAMYPTSIEELFDVADAGLLMPPKSTWFEPKLRSGLFIHSLV